MLRVNGFKWLARGIVVCAGSSPPKRGTSPRATFFCLQKRGAIRDSPKRGWAQMLSTLD